MVPLSATLKSRLEKADQAIDLIAHAGAADLQRGILASYTDWPAGRVAEIIENALIAYAANGATR